MCRMSICMSEFLPSHKKIHGGEPKEENWHEKASVRAHDAAAVSGFIHIFILSASVTVCRPHFSVKKCFLTHHHCHTPSSLLLLFFLLYIPYPLFAPPQHIFLLLLPCPPSFSLSLNLTFPPQISFLTLFLFSAVTALLPAASLRCFRVLLYSWQQGWRKNTQQKYICCWVSEREKKSQTWMLRDFTDLTFVQDPDLDLLNHNSWAVRRNKNSSGRFAAWSQ